MDRVNAKQAVTEFISKYKFAVIVFAVGLFLMILPDFGTDQQSHAPQETTVIRESSIEEKLSDTLSLVKGAGKVQVMLSYASGQETVYQSATDLTEGEKSKSEKNNTVTVTDHERNQTGLIRRVDPPICLGALIVCQGADDPVVKLAIVEAVTRITGLSSDKICVLKMK